MKQIQAIVQGLVQGVGFRYATQKEALRLGLTGYVRNVPDGTVEIVAEGPEEQVMALMQWAHQGPPAAQVIGVETCDRPPTGRFSTFSIER
jgi:acylphosphatase